MGEKILPNYNLDQFSARQLSKNLHVRTSAELGYEDGVADPLTPSWEGSAPIPKETVGRELVSRLNGQLPSVEREGVIADLRQSRKMLVKHRDELTKVQETNLKRIETLIDFTQSQKTGIGDSLALPYSTIQPKKNPFKGAGLP